jgi:histone acetyltransferase (RNA polymerase elongator complex component)
MILPIFISFAGCPHRCIFCNQQIINGQKENTLRAAQRQMEELERWVHPDPANELAFYGGSFTALSLTEQEALLAWADQRRQQGLFGAIRLSTRPDAITPPILDQLARYGVTTVELGVQSLDDKVLTTVERGHTAADVDRAVALLRQYGFRVGLQLMVGLPGQTRQSLLETLDHVLALQPDGCRIYPLLVIKDTKLATWYQKGLYTPITLEQAIEETALLHSTLEAHHIPVIRMGLQPDRDLCAPGHILAGPFHPAFGELVRSYEWRQIIASRIAGQGLGNYNMVITCPDSLASVLRGQHHANVRAWEAGGNIKVSFVPGQKVEVNFYDR